MLSQAQPKPDVPVTGPFHSGEPAPVPAPRGLFVLLLGYFALQVVLRVTFSSSVDLDESEQVVLGQRFSWGYGSDPPLYTWLQIPFFWIFGESVLALSLLKNLLLLCNYSLTFATARLATRSSAAAVAAALSLLYLPGVAWESQRDLTHTILCATLALATLFCLVRLQEQRTLGRYVWFGLCAGLGLVSKYNYALWALGLVLAAVSLPELRPAMLDRRMLLALVLALGIFAPNGVWVLEHRELALLTASKFEISQSAGWVTVLRTGLKNVVQSLLSFGLPITVIYGLLFFGAPQRTEAESHLVYRRLILRAWVVIGGTLMLLIVFAHATGFKERWFQPILICLPIMAVSLVRNRLDARRLKYIAGISVMVMAAVALVMPGRLVMAERLKREEPLTRPYANLAAQLRGAVPPGSLVICEPRLLAGNLRLGLRDSTVITPELTPLFPEKHLHTFLVWEAKRSELPPDSLRQWTKHYTGQEIRNSPPRYFSAPYKFHRNKQWRLGVVQVN